jgi:integrase
MSTTTELRIEEARKLPHIQRLRSGYHYFRLCKVKGRLPGLEGSPEYFTRHEELLSLAEGRKPEPPPEGRPVRVAFTAGSVGWVAAQYVASHEFRSKKPGTQYAYQRMLHLMRENDSGIARRLLKDVSSEIVARHCHLIEAKHGRACGDHQAMVLSILWRFAKRTGLRECRLVGLTNPCRERGRSKSTPHSAWPVDVQRRFLKGASPQLRLAFLAAFWTAQRRGDLVKMKWSDFDGRHINVIQEKSGKRIKMRVHRELLVMLNNMPRVSDHILVNKVGKRFMSKSTLSKHVQARLVEIGEPRGRYVLHGLRHGAGVDLAMNGFGTKQIMAIMGHSSPAMSLHYQRKADESKMIADVVGRWRRAA